MLEVGAVENARGHEHHIGLGGGERRRRDILEDLAEVCGVAVDRMNARGPVEIGEGALERGTVLQHVAGTRRTAQVVLQYQVVALSVADQVGPADVDVDVLGHVESHELAPKMLRAEDVVGRDDAVLEDLLLVVDVVQEEIERGDALDQSLFDGLPFGVGNDARHEVEREDPLGPLIVIVDREGDATPHEGQVDRSLLPLVLCLVEMFQVLGDSSIVGADGPRFIEHLVTKITAVVSL